MITSQIQVNGLWRNLLVVESDTPTTWDTPEIIHDIPTDSGLIRVHYHTEGLYQHIEEYGKHFYWFLYNSTHTTIDGESMELADLKHANDILMGVQS